MKIESRSEKSVILASGRALSSLAMILTMAVLSRLFGKADYGTFMQLLLIYQFATPFCLLGFHQAPYYFVPREPDRVRNIVAVTLCFLFITGTLAMLLLLCGGNQLVGQLFRNERLPLMLLIFAPYFLFMIPTAATDACLLACNRPVQLAVFNMTTRLLLFVLVASSCFLFPTLMTAMVSMVATACLLLAFSLYLIVAACKTGRWSLSVADFKHQFRFAVPLGVAYLVGTIDRLTAGTVVSSLSTPEEYAAFANGAIELPIIGLLATSVAAVLIADFARLYQEGNITEIVRLIHRSVGKCAVIAFPMGCFCFAFAEDIILFVFGKNYQQSILIFQIYLFILPARIFNFTSLFIAMNKTKYMLYIQAIACVLNIACAIPAVYCFGTIGAALVSVGVMQLVIIPLLALAISREIHVPLTTLVPLKRLGLILVLAAASALLVWTVLSLIPVEIPSGLLRLAIAFISFGATCYAMMYLMRVEDFMDIRSLIHKRLGKK